MCISTVADSDNTVFTALRENNSAKTSASEHCNSALCPAVLCSLEMDSSVTQKATRSSSPEHCELYASQCGIKYWCVCTCACVCSCVCARVAACACVRMIL